MTSLPYDVSKDELIGYLHTMILIRHFEELALQLFSQGRLVGACHVCVGQEATAVGTCCLLQRDDYVVSHHRGHGHLIAKGGDVKRMMAELFGRETGYCHGRGGSMHIAAVELGHLGANGIVGGGLPIAVGAGLSIKYRGTDQVATVYLGDAVTNIGSFHEAMNFAAAFKLPVIFVCENNLYALSTPITYSSAEPDLAAKARAYRMPALVADGMDILAVRAAMQEAVARARGGEGPTFIECKTYRYYGHSKSDSRPYRTREEEAEWRRRDPIDSLATRLIEAGYIEAEGVTALRTEADRLLAEAVEYAESSPWPEAVEAEEYVFT